VKKLPLNVTIPFALLTALAAAAGAVTEYDFQFHNYPNPFFPGEGDAEFSYYLPSGGTVSIYVYDFESRRVRTVAEGEKQVYGSHQGEWRWDGRDDRGELVVPGPYVVVLEVTVQGNVYRDTFVAIVNP
jgi:hypothetical protein